MGWQPSKNLSIWWCLGEVIQESTGFHQYRITARWKKSSKIHNHWPLGLSRKLSGFSRPIQERIRTTWCAMRKTNWTRNSAWHVGIYKQRDAVNLANAYFQHLLRNIYHPGQSNRRQRTCQPRGVTQIRHGKRRVIIKISGPRVLLVAFLCTRQTYRCTY